MAHLSHLSRRFVTSLRPGGPSATDREWVATQLSEAELELWRALRGPDRRHSVLVARRVERALGHDAGREVLAAALLHDVGKSVAGLGTYGRVIATVSGAVAGHHMAYRWSEAKGFVRRVGLYLRHPELGGDLLAMAESHSLTVAWAREHHLGPDDWTVPAHIGQALKACDDD
ncbi:MAG: hypothetical protein U5K29_01905 [Acidimicrobiales bacterium]|nr:hypothetical protein [Acidimicrobiales bacterium]